MCEYVHVSTSLKRPDMIASTVAYYLGVSLVQRESLVTLTLSVNIVTNSGNVFSVVISVFPLVECISKKELQ